MRKKIIPLLVTLCFLVCSPSLMASPRLLPNVEKEYLRAEAWLNSEEEGKIILAPEEISALNKMMKSPTMPDLKTYPAKISREQLKTYLQDYEMDDALYVNGEHITAMKAKEIVDDVNLAALPAEKAVKYGVVVKRSDLRSFPTSLRAYKDPGDKDFDIWQETVVDPAEPVIILHQNKKGNFVFAQMRNYRGWLPTNQVAVTDRASWLRYVEPEDFAIVTARLARLSASGAKWTFQMGSKIPTKGKLQLPTRDKKGYLKIREVKPEYGQVLHEGYLPYTENNLVRQAFKHLGSPYGWGGLKESVDCSSFVADVYRTVGVELPRNADEQEEALAENQLQLSGYNSDEKLAALADLPLGSALFMPSHVMLYLGSKAGRPYIIHALSSYGRKAANGNYQSVPVSEVVVSDVFLTARNGDTLLERLTAAHSYQ